MQSQGWLLSSISKLKIVFHFLLIDQESRTGLFKKGQHGLKCRQKNTRLKRNGYSIETGARERLVPMTLTRCFFV